MEPRRHCALRLADHSIAALGAVVGSVHIRRTCGLWGGRAYHGGQLQPARRPGERAIRQFRGHGVRQQRRGQTRSVFSQRCGGRPLHTIYRAPENLWADIGLPVLSECIDATTQSTVGTFDMLKRLLFVLPSLTLAATLAVPLTVPAAADDTFQWLESPKDPAALKWAVEQSNATRSALAAKPIYGQVAAELKAVLGANEPPPDYTLLGNKAVRLRRDAAHPHGLLEVALRGADGAPGEWRLALDVDALRVAEVKPYELHWYSAKDTCLAPAFDRCLLMLSPGGGDQVELREFDLLKAQFVKDGFRTVASRTQAAWLSRDRVLIAHGAEHEPLTVAGWPRAVHLWL